MAGLTGRYMRDLERALRFDRQLADRARDDFAEYLAESLDETAENDSEAAEQRVLRGFGEVEEIARSYVLAGFPRLVRRTLALAGWLALATFLFMRLRSSQLGLNSFTEPTILGAIDSIGFGIGAILCVLAWRRSVTRDVLWAARTRQLLALACAAIGISSVASLGRAIPAIMGGASGSGSLLILATGLIQLGLLALLILRIRLIGSYARSIAPG